MSYILDALRRADAERERGRVPGLNAQAIDLVADEGPRRRGVAPWVWALLGAGVVLALVLSWSWLSRDEPPTAIVSAPPPPLPVAPAPPPPVAAAPAEPTAPARVEPPPSPVAEPPVRAAAPRKPPRRESQAARRVPAADSAASAAAEPPATPYAQLPEDFRRGIPVLTIGGSTYSPNPASRMLIVNGLVQREGDEPAPGVTIRQIKLRSAVFEFRGQRYEVGF